MAFQISHGKIRKKEFLIITGTEGVGKSTFGSEAPSPIFIPVEDGSYGLDVGRFPKPTSYDEVMAMLSDPQLKDFETLVIDSLDHLEPLVWEKTVQMHKNDKEFKNAEIKNIEGFGYGKGYVLAEKYWRDFLNLLAELRERMNIILTAHTQIKSINDPLQPLPYDKYVIKLQNRAKALTFETVDTVLFANFEMYLKEEDRSNKGKAYGEGKRFLYTQGRPGHEAKNRDGLPYQIPMEKGKAWSNYIATKNIEVEDHRKIQSTIRGYLTLISDDELKEKVEKSLADAGDDVKKLSNVLKKLEIKLGVKK